MSDTQYRAINEATLFQERRFISEGDVFECAGPYLVTGYLRLDQPHMQIRQNADWQQMDTTELCWLLPPWSIFHYRCQKLQVHSQVHIFRLENPERWSRFQGPKLLPMALTTDLPDSKLDLSHWMTRFDICEPLYQEDAISPSSRSLKKAIELALEEATPLRDIARQLKLNPTVMGRHFKADFGMTPKQYQNRLRIIASIDHLLRGDAPIDAGFNAGFNDLSRFYHQFKKTTATSPVKYLAQSKNAKTESSD